MTTDDANVYSPETVRQIAADRGLRLDDREVDHVVSYLDGMAAGLDEMRSVPLHMVGDDVRLPTDVIRWVERYGLHDPVVADIGTGHGDVDDGGGDDG